MGVLDELMGNASEINLDNVREECSKLMALGETVEQAYSLLRDKLLFTNKRLIMVNKQGVTGKKVEFHSIPYNKIAHFSIETAGNFEIESELKIWIVGMGKDPIQMTFGKNQDVYKVQSVLAYYISE
jgi:hypothetical protein